jgi:D-inositol-3-phosphate glycosyltransferase
MFGRSRRLNATVPKTEESTIANQSHGEYPGSGQGSLQKGRAEVNRVGIFWAAAGVSSITDPFQSSGKYVAATALTRAVACHSAAPNVEIFVPLQRIEKCRQQLHGLPVEVFGMETSTARLFAESDLPARFRAHGFDVLHEPIDVDFTRGSYIRSHFSRRVFPVTCSQMGISYSTQLHFGLPRMLTARVYPCDAVVCATNSAREGMVRRLSDVAERYSRAWDRPAPPLPRLEVIPWGVDADLFSPRDQTSARRELDLPLDRPIVLCLGRLRIEDKMDWTPPLLAFEHVLRRTKQRPLFVLAGSSSTEYTQEVLNHAEQLGLGPSVRCFFNLPPTCLPTLYAACDVFVSPADSPTETFGLTIVEAMACARPVVASDWDGYKELVVHGDTGFKARTDWADCLSEVNQAAPFLAWDHEHLHVGQSVSIDVGELAGYITELVERPELRLRLGEQGRARVKALYDWPVVVGQWRELWSELGAIAATLEPDPLGSLDYMRPEYFRHFSHYASRVIDDSAEVVLTSRGGDLLAGKCPLFLHSWAKGFLRPEYLLEALGVLKPAARLGARPLVGDVVQVIRKRLGLSHDAALMHLMWLAKYDLVSFGGDRIASPIQSG